MFAAAVTRSDLLPAAARRLLGADIVVVGGDLCHWQGPLLPGEEAAIARARPPRRREFAAGRTAARHALAMLGHPPGPLPRRADGPVQWPHGVTGSLSHGGGHVLVAVGRTGAGLSALGVDVEPFVAMAADIAAEVCRPDEDASEAMRIFGAKEAAYKAQFALTAQMLDYSAMRVTLDENGWFEAELMVALPGMARGCCLVGWQVRVGSLLLSTVRIR